MALHPEFKLLILQKRIIVGVDILEEHLLLFSSNLAIHVLVIYGKKIRLIVALCFLHPSKSVVFCTFLALFFKNAIPLSLIDAVFFHQILERQ